MLLSTSTRIHMAVKRHTKWKEKLWLWKTHKPRSELSVMLTRMPSKHTRHSEISSDTALTADKSAVTDDTCVGFYTHLRVCCPTVRLRHKSSLVHRYTCVTAVTPLNRTRRALGWEVAVMSRMHFAQSAFYAVPRGGIEQRPFPTEVRRPNHWDTMTTLK